MKTYYSFTPIFYSLLLSLLCCVAALSMEMLVIQEQEQFYALPKYQAPSKPVVHFENDKKPQLPQQNPLNIQATNKVENRTYSTTSMITNNRIPHSTNSQDVVEDIYSQELRQAIRETIGKSKGGPIYLQYLLPTLLKEPRFKADRERIRANVLKHNLYLTSEMAEVLGIDRADRALTSMTPVRQSNSLPASTHYQLPRSQSMAKP